MQKSRLGKAPPKFAIANGFAIGSIPREVIAENSESAMPNTRHAFPTIIEFIQGTLIDGSGGNNDEGDNAQGAQQNPGAPPSMGAISNEHGLDEKQEIAYEVICCTYLLRVIQEEATAAAVNSAFAALDDQTSSQKEELIESLKARGGKDQLLMFLTGAGGCGKSHCVYAARKFCHRFSQAAGIVFEKNTFWFTLSR